MFTYLGTKPSMDEDFSSRSVETTTHQIKFSYSKLKDLPSGKKIRSSTFVAGPKGIIVDIYPQTSVKEPNNIEFDWIFRCQSTASISFGFTFLDKHGKPASKISERMTFTVSPYFGKNCFRNFIERSILEAEFVKDDCFTIVYSVTLLSDSYKEVPKQLVNGIIPSGIIEHFAKLLEDRELADVTFEVGGEIFTGHRLVLSARSPVFRAPLYGEMVESKMKNIQIKDMTPVIFKAMLHYIYTDSLVDMSDEDIPLVASVQCLLQVADFYALDGLKTICEERLMRDLSMDTVISSLALAEEHNCPMLKNACLHFASRHGNLLKLALTAEYVQLMQRNPSLLEDFGDHVRGNIDFIIPAAKKQREK